MHKNLEHLERLTNNLPTIPDLIPTQLPVNSKIVSYNTKSGSCIAECLMNIDAIAVAICDMSSGTIGPRHSHGEKEWMIVYDGEIIVEVEGIKANGVERLTGEKDSIVLSDGDYLFIGERTPHTVSSVKGARFLTVTVPSSEVFPRDDGQ